MIVYSPFPHHLVPSVERAVARRCELFRELPEARRKELAANAVGLARTQSATVIAFWREAFDAVEADPWAYIEQTIDDPAWTLFNRGPGPGPWARNALDAYARIRTAEVALGRCTETTPRSEFHVRPLDAGHLDRAQALAEAILEEARERFEDYAARLQGDTSQRDWRKQAEDELFEDAVASGLSHRAAAVVACHLVVAAAEGLPVEDGKVLKRRAEAARKRAQRRRNG